MDVERRRARWVGAAGAVAVAYCGIVALVPTGFVAMSPGPTFNTIGTVDGTPLIEISGHPTYPTGGALDMTTVSERGGPFGQLYVAQVLAAWRNPDVRVLPTHTVYSDDVSADQVAQENQQDFVGSQSNAVAAALRHLDIPVTEHARVAEVADGGPSAGKLTPGDVFRTVAGQEVTGGSSVTEALAAHRPGETVQVGYERDGADATTQITLGAAPDDPSRAILGILVETTYTGPFPIDFTLEDVGGPSAGLAFSLGIVDKLTPGELTGGRHVAATGTIDPDGTVGVIGGIAQKMVGAVSSGATFFLAPRSNCDEVVGHVPEGLTVAAVGTLDEAIAALDDYTAGRAAPSCAATP